MATKARAGKRGAIPQKIEAGKMTSFTKPVEKNATKTRNFSEGELDIMESVDHTSSVHHYFTDPDDGNIKRIIKRKY